MNQTAIKLRDLILASEGGQDDCIKLGDECDCQNSKGITLNRLLMAMWKKCSSTIAIDLQGRFWDYDFKHCSEWSINLTHTNILDNDEPTLAKLVDLLTKK